MKKYIFITHVEMVEVATEEFRPEYYCNYYRRVDDLLQEFMVAQLADDEPSKECTELSRIVNQLSLVSRFNPHKNYRMSVVVFDDDDDTDKEITALMDEQHAPTIKMIRKSGDTHKI